MSEPARFISGLTQNTLNQPLGALGVPDPFFCMLDADDFSPWNPTAWNLAQPNGSTVSAIAGAGGIVQITAPASTETPIGFERNLGGFLPNLQSRLAFMTRFRMDQANTNLFCGLADPTGDPFKVDGETSIGFYLQASWSGDITFEVYKDDAQTLEYNIPFVPTVGVWYDIGWIWNPFHMEFELMFGQALIGQKIGANSASQQPIARVSAGVQIVPSELVLAPAFGVQSPGAGVQKVSCDFIYCAMER